VGTVGGTEYKCPKNKTHKEYLLKAAIAKKANKIYNGPYHTQNKWQCYVAERQWWDWVSYSDKFPEDKCLMVVRFEMTQEIIDHITGKLINISEWLIDNGYGF